MARETLREGEGRNKRQEDEKRGRGRGRKSRRPEREKRDGGQRTIGEKRKGGPGEPP